MWALVLIACACLFFYTLLNIVGLIWALLLQLLIGAVITFMFLLVLGIRQGLKEEELSEVVDD